MLDTESRHSTGLDQGPTRDPWLTMDYYLGTDSLSLQEMLDVDIKCEIEGVIGGHPELGFNFTDLSPLELDDDPVGCQGDLNGWFGAASLLNGNSNSSHSLDLSDGDVATIKFNPDSLMTSARSLSSRSEKLRSEFTSRTSVNQETMSSDRYRPLFVEVKEEHFDIEDESEDVICIESDEDEEDQKSEHENSEDEISVINLSDIDLRNPVKTSQIPQKRDSALHQVQGRNFNIQPAAPSKSRKRNSSVGKQIHDENFHSNDSTTTLTVSMGRDTDMTKIDAKYYPKPAYSYSCLIAMALKNSRTGFLPVPKIYNFICEHFPYFRRAPAIWKNSIRHVLSANTTFRRINAPGQGIRRKGSLWTINKKKSAMINNQLMRCSRLHASSIKHSMTYPDRLESLKNGITNNFNLDLSGGDAATIMVNPNSVMPHSSVRSPSPAVNDNERTEETTEDVDRTTSKDTSSRRHFSFSTSIKEEQVDIEDDAETGNETETEQYENDITETEDEDSEDEIVSNKFSGRSIKSKHQLQMNGSSQKSVVKNSQTSQKMNPLAQIRVRNFKILQASPSSTPSGQSHHVRKQIYNNNVHMNASTTTLPTSMKRDIDMTEFDEKPYPKPAYSYSCLIAMALKNSQTGSLPVSEIYNFMCEHFPYFKTAPNGWKNSVRHNLSLNKCFEKIEKPAGNGNQRKGCLWAINPAKIAKMDEEVSKWSRKDPLAIKKAMIYPDHLELLERGEMKYAGTGSDLSEETESSGDEAIEESVTYGDELVHGHVAANSVTDSYDESSQDCDVDIAEQLYDEIDIEEDNKEALHMQFNISKQSEPFEYELSPSTKRQKTLTSTLQGNYVYQTVSTSRRKTPLLVRAAANTGTFLKIE